MALRTVNLTGMDVLVSRRVQVRVHDLTTRRLKSLVLHGITIDLWILIYNATSRSQLRKHASSRVLRLWIMLFLFVLVEHWCLYRQLISWLVIVERAARCWLVASILVVRLDEVALSLALASVATPTVACFPLLLKTIASYFFLWLEIAHRCLTAWELIKQFCSDPPTWLIDLVDWAYNLLAPAVW